MFYCAIPFRGVVVLETLLVPSGGFGLHAVTAMLKSEAAQASRRMPNKLREERMVFHDSECGELESGLRFKTVRVRKALTGPVCVNQP